MRYIKNWKQFQRVLISIFLWIIAAIWYIPIFWMLSTSLKSTQIAITEDPPRLIPKEPTLENYKTVFSAASGISVMRGIINSIIVAVVSTILGLVIATPAAYALSRLNFKGRNAIFWSYVAILAFPGVLFLVPQYFIIHRLGLMDNFLALILPGLGSTFGVFLLRQYMLGIPRELEDAAWIDGCSRLRFLITVVIPYVKPALTTLALMSFLGSWNSFLWPLLVMNSPEKLTLPIALVRFSAGWGDPFRGIGPLMAGAFISVLPTLIIFVVFHKYLMQGISLSVGEK
ncbi:MULTISPECIES: carbohydrate ABC transporter permease [Dictyoglomus]|jgi:multiple sugar transport system permease protein|uniref:Binding-protein-dependent transport systems inner membrane component n=1 Tax=Dictyoglomus turgidum (strain DSM 6724 / Z-1310) TaxID=515635 RepID=B8E3C8_DICTD|nr:MULTISPECIES: carbohydrate ABC transporter permease [Dictyoglomus]ACK43002.1 binding-protein-dependent transport systems inner membrane component [Dictyoglomus turgidum DSM 6724]PNV78940.1 MAG: carbohydrate ABC transporter permease [Dictyoglomus turgidum]HBU31067.1 carbohydrate ABC transporter permease [Dictyoglomus sp.]